mgnify:CR=1 FL=1
MSRESEFAPLEHLGLSEGDPLQTSSSQKLFGWGLGLLSLAIVVGVGAVAAVVLTYAWAFFSILTAG